MPEIREEDLVALYDQINDAENKKAELEYIVDYKEKKIVKSYKEKKTLIAIILGVIIINILSFGYLIYVDKIQLSTPEKKQVATQEVEEITPLKEISEQEETTTVIDSISQDTISNNGGEAILSEEEKLVIQEEKEKLEELREFYLAKNLLDKEKIYTVQISAIASENQEISLISDNLSNHRIYRDNEYLKFSLGIFETLAEAQEFRKILIDTGFRKGIFIISYKNGRRLQIEPSS
ncbi:hypothetical protein [Aquimarina rhabdastrellae]